VQHFLREEGGLFPPFPVENSGQIA